MNIVKIKDGLSFCDGWYDLECMEVFCWYKFFGLVMYIYIVIDMYINIVVFFCDSLE